MRNITSHDIRDVFSYSHKYKNKTFVLYIDDEMLSSEMMLVLVKDIVYMLRSGIRIMIVPEVRNSVVINGDTHNLQHAWTVLSEEDIPKIQRASFDVVSQIITCFARYRQTAVIGNWTLARSYGVISGVDYKHSGFVDKIDRVALDTLLRDGIIPVFPAIGWSYTGRPYYLNPMEVATQASVMMRATKLIFILSARRHAQFTTLIPKRKDAHYVRRMTAPEAKQVLELELDNDTSSDHQSVKYAVQALDRGVDRVHMLNGEQDGSLLIEIFSNDGLGVMMYADKYGAITPMQKEDATDVLLLMQPLMRQEILKPRTIEDIIEEHADFVVYKADGHIRGVAALHDIGESAAEIAALATNAQEDSQGIGTTLVQYLLAKAKKQKYARVFVFTLKTGDWFERLGFVKLQDKSALPRERLAQHMASKRQSRVYYMETSAISSDLST